MANREVLLRFATRALDKAKAIANSIKVTVDSTSKTVTFQRREIQAAVRERAALARVLRSGAREEEGRAPGIQRGRAALERARQGISNPLFVREGLERGRSVLNAGAALAAGGTGLSGDIATRLAFALPQTAITAIAVTVTSSVLREVDKVLEARFRARDDLLRVQVARELETLEQRRKRDPNVDRAAREEAGRDLAARRAFERRRGIEPTAERAAGE